jgi:hypothetical protein
MKDAVTTAIAREQDLLSERLASPEVAAAIARFF